MIGQTLGHYRILERVAAGGMGVVYRARDEQLERDVAVKVLPSGTLSGDAARRHFRREAMALARLNHPHIETVYDFGTQDDIDFLVMEYVPGKTLAERLSGGALPEKEIIELGMQIASALEEAHERGIVHRDLKPANIAVTAKGYAKILDFGLARLLRPVEDESTEILSDSKAAAGTLPYMPPEQLKGERVDGRADIYTIGAVLYEMATGCRAFREELASRLIDAILHQPVVPPRALNRRISPELETIILKCLDKDPDRRFQSAKELLVDLRRLQLASSGAVLPTTRRRDAKARGTWIAYSIAGVFALVAVQIAFNVAGWRDRLLGRARTPQIRSLAVLPLENLSHDPEQEYFVDGMTDALIAELSHIGALRVISRTSMMQYKGSKKSLPQIARDLQVDAVVEGSVQRSGERVRVTAQLIYAPTDAHVWAHVYDRELRDILELESNVARTIADEIHVKLTPREETHLTTARVVNPAAYEAYLRGRYFWNKRTPEDLRKGAEYFQKAVDLDPTYALAHAGLADGYILLAIYDERLPREVMPLAKAAAKRALQLDDSLAEAHASLAYIEWAYDWDLVSAEAEFERALALNPGYATAREWHGLYLDQVGRFDEAAGEMQRAHEVDPLSQVIEVNVGRCYYFARRYGRAVEFLQQFAEREPDSWIGHAILGQTYLVMGRVDEAIDELERANALLPDSPRNLGVLGDAYARAGRRNEARTLVEKLSEFSHKRYVPPVYSAMVYMGLGDKSQALSFLEQAFLDRSDWMVQLNADPEFDLLRTDPRFGALLRRVGEERLDKPLPRGHWALQLSLPKFH